MSLLSLPSLDECVTIEEGEELIQHKVLSYVAVLLLKPTSDDKIL